MRKVSGSREVGAEQGQDGVGTDVPNVRTKCFFVFMLDNVRPSSPNKVVWSRYAAVGAAKKRRRLRESAHVHVLGALPVHVRGGIHLGHSARVTLTRLAPRRFDDDNWQAAAKPIRDGVADAFGLRDDAVNLAWKYDQRRGQPKQYAVEIRIEVQQ